MPQTLITEDDPRGRTNMSRPMTDAEFDEIIARVTKRQVAAAFKATTETTEPPPATPPAPTSSKASDDAFLVQGAEYQNRGLKAFGDHIEGKASPEPDLKSPGNAWNGRAWASLAEILEKEQAERAAKADRR